MPISSFYGLQTSLRGLLAQQRALDTTGHNIANASTAGYSRQEAVLAAAPALVIPQGAVQGGAGAHIGAGVDVLSYRRIRDTFLDLQYRAQATRLGNEAGKAEGLDRAELALTEPSETGINQKLAEFWSAWGDLSNGADDISARTALIEAADSLAESFSIVDGQLELVGQQAADEYAAFTAPGGEVEQIGRELAALNDTIKAFVTAGNPPNDLMDQRDMLLDKLSALGTTSIVNNADGSVDVTFGGATAPMVDGTGYHAEPLGTNPGGRLGALKDLSTVPGGLIDSYRTELGAVASTLAGAVNAIHPGFFAVTHAPPATYGGDDARRRRDDRDAVPRRDDRGQRQRGRARGVRAERQGPRRRVQRLRRPRRLRGPRGHAQRGQRRGAHRRGAGPPRERRRRLAGRGDGQHHQVPAGLPGVLARHVDDGRDARRPDQPDRASGALMSMARPSP